VSQLKAGKGLTLVAECVEGQFAQMAGTEVEQTKEVSECTGKDGDGEKGICCGRTFLRKPREQSNFSQF
jgi:hypothetical protein